MTQPRRRRGTLSEADREVWAAYAATVPALPGRTAPPSSPPTPTALAAAPAPAAPAPIPRARAPVLPLSVGDMPGGIDKASWRRLISGRLRPERRLDLHGHTLDQAHAALIRFLDGARAEGVRCVEVITGGGGAARGGLRGEGAIRRELPHWLNLPTLRPLVLAATYPHAANQGAVLLLLRRAAGGGR